MSKELIEKKQVLISQLKTIISTLCDDKIELKYRLDDDELRITAYCSARDTAALIGRGAMIKLSIIRLLELKKRKIDFHHRLDFWVKERVPENEEVTEKE